MASKVAADLYFDIKTDLSGLKKGLADAKKEIRASSKSIKTAQASMYKQMKNDAVRAIRQLESLVVAIYGVKKAYDVTIGRGHEFNKMMEAEKIGLSLMIVQKLKDVDVTGQQVTQMEKWAYANKIAATEMEAVRAINAETPHTLSQTIQLYGVMRGQMLEAGATAKQTVEMVKNLSLVGAAANVEFSGMIKTLDQLLAGHMKASDMQIALKNILGITQEEIRAANEAGKEIEYLEEKLYGAAVASEAVKQSWGGMMSNFINIWDEIAAEVQKPIFDAWKEDLKTMRKYLVENKDAIVDNAKALGNLADEALNVFVAFGFAKFLAPRFTMIANSIKLARLQMIQLHLSAIAVGASMTGLQVKMALLGASIKAFGAALSKLFISNLPFLAIAAAIYVVTTALEAMGKAAAETNRVLGLTVKELEELGKHSRAAAMDTLQGALKDSNREAIRLGRELSDAIAYKDTLFGKTQEEINAIGKVYEAEVKRTEEIKTQIGNLEQVNVKLAEAKDIAFKASDAAAELATNLSIAKGEAFELARALDGAILGFEKQLVRVKELTGEISATTALTSNFSLDTANIAAQTQELDKQMEAAQEIFAVTKDQAQFDDLSYKIALKYVGLETRKLKIKETLLVGEKRIAKEAVKTATSAAKSVKAAKSTAGYLKEQADAFGAIAKGFDAGTIDRYFEGVVASSADALDDLRDQWEDIGDEIGSSLSDAFEDILGGDTTKAFQDLFKDLLKEVTTFAISAIIQFAAMGQQAGILAVLTQGQGDPYSAFARMAAMAAAVAALGVSVAFSGSSSSGKVSEADLAAAEGITGVQSTSVEDAIDLIAENSTVGLAYSSRMATSLDSLVFATAGAARGLGTEFTGETYDLTKGSDGIWGGKTYDLLSTGIWIKSATLDDIKNGQLEATKYTKELVKKSSWFGLKSKESISTTLQGDVDRGVMKDIEDAYLSGVDVIREASMALGMTAAEFEQYAAQWETSLAQLNLEGMSAAEISETIAGVIAADLDMWASTLGLVAEYAEEFAKVGESTALTIVRLANEFEVLDQSFDQLGWSLAAVGDGGLLMSQSMIKAAGDLGSAVAKLDFYFQNFYTTEEQLALKTSMLQATFVGLGLTLPTTIEGMKKLIEIKRADIAMLAGQIKADEFKLKSDLAIVKATAGIGEVAIAIAVGIYNEGIKILDEAKARLDTMTVELDNILDTLPIWTEVYGNADDAMAGAAKSADVMTSSVGAVSEAMTDFTDQHIAANFAALDMVGDIYGELMAQIAEFADAFSDLFDKIEHRTMTLNEALELVNSVTLDNYKAVLSQLDASRKQEETDVNDWNKAVLDTLNEQKKFLETMMKDVEKIRDSIINIQDLAKGNNEVYAADKFFSLQEEIVRRLASQESITDIVGDYTASASSYASAVRGTAATSPEAEFETLRIAAMMEESLKGADYTAATLDSVEAQIEITNDILTLQLMRIQDKYEAGVLGIMEALNIEFDDWVDETATFYAQYLGASSELVVGILSLHDRASEQWTEEQKQNITARNKEDAAWALFAYNQVVDRSAMEFGLDNLGLALAYDGTINTTLRDNLGIYLPRLMTVNAAKAIKSAELLAQDNQATMATVVAASIAVNKEMSAFDRSAAWSISEKSGKDAKITRESLESIYGRSKIFAESYAGRTDAVSWAIDAKSKIYGDNWAQRQSNNDWAINGRAREDARTASNNAWAISGRANKLQGDLKKLALGSNGYSKTMKDHLNTIAWKAKAEKLRNMSNEDRLRLEDAFKNAREASEANKSAQETAYDQVEWANKFMVDKCTFTSTVNALKTSNWTGLSAVNNSIRGLNTGGTDSGVQSAVYSAGHTAASATYNIGDQISSAIYATRATATPMASGGIVMKPINAIVGEAGYPEAVIPLKDPNDPLGMKKTNKLLKSMDDRLKSIEFTNDKIRLSSKRQVTVSEESAFLIEERL